jgi:RNA polymerase sigma-70 factor, ECF subfamily
VVITDTYVGRPDLDVSFQCVRRDLAPADSPLDSGRARARRDVVLDEPTELIEGVRPSASPGMRQVDGWGARCRADATGEVWIRELFEEHGRAMLAYSVRLTGDRSAAEDVVQEALVRAWRGREGLVERRISIRAWLFTVIRNLVADGFRARNARPIEVAAMPRTDPIERDHADRVVNSMLVFQALDSLSPEHRAVLEDVYLHGNTVRETAKRLGIPPGTVKSRTYYALRSLHELLRDLDCAEAPAAMAG